MANAKIANKDNRTTVFLTSGDENREFTRDPDGLTYFVQRAYDGALVKRHLIPADTYRDVLRAAQQYAAAEADIRRTLKATRNVGHRQ